MFICQTLKIRVFSKKQIQHNCLAKFRLVMVKKKFFARTHDCPESSKSVSVSVSAFNGHFSLATAQSQSYATDWWQEKNVQNQEREPALSASYSHICLSFTKHLRNI